MNMRFSYKDYMTFQKLMRILMSNNIHAGARIMSDSDCEDCATDVGGVFYNRNTNIVVLTQSYKDGRYADNSEWTPLR